MKAADYANAFIVVMFTVGFAYLSWYKFFDGVLRHTLRHAKRNKVTVTPQTAQFIVFVGSTFVGALIGLAVGNAIGIYVYLFMAVR